jgi:hypothetical protein
MDISSVAYQKAIAVLAKQHHDDHALVSCLPTDPSVSSSGMDIGMSFCSLVPTLFLRLFVLFLDHPAGAITNPDRKSVDRARDIVSNPVISELIDEDSQAQDAFTGSLRRQIVANCQHLRVHLLLVDRLMTLYNESASSAKTAEAPKTAT